MCAVDHKVTLWEKPGRVGFACSCGVDGSTSSVAPDQFEVLVRRLHPGAEQER